MIFRLLSMKRGRAARVDITTTCMKYANSSSSNTSRAVGPPGSDDKILLSSLQWPGVRPPDLNSLIALGLEEAVLTPATCLLKKLTKPKPGSKDLGSLSYNCMWGIHSNHLYSVCGCFSEIYVLN